MFTKKLICGKCNFVNPPAASRCVHCGEKLITDNNKILWDRGDSDIAQRFDLSKKAGHFRQTLMVSEGTNAIMITGAECRGVLPPGTYEKFGNTLEKCGVANQNDTISIIFVDTAEFSLDFKLECGSLISGDGIHLGFEGRVLARMIEPEDFYQNYFKNRYSMRVQEIDDDLQETMSYTLRPFVTNSQIKDILGNSDLNEKMKSTIISQLNEAIDTKGLFIQEILWLKFTTRY